MSSGKRRNAASEEAAEQHAQIGAKSCDAKAAFQRNPHPDAQWFHEACLGLFMHFGISSVRGEGDISWSMMKRPPARAESASRYGLYAVQSNPTPANYWAQAKDFKADKFDPFKILSAAKAAGFRYAVLTTKHHDGFALWPSKSGNFGIAKFQPGRDIVREYAEACRKAGLKLGFYYSPPDWHFNQARMSFNYGGRKPDLDIHHKPVELPKLSKAEEEAFDNRFREHIKVQVEELLSNYGKVDLLWFDGDGKDAISIERIRELQPGIVINPRAHGVGDFDTSECQFPKTRFPGWWEYCHVFSDGAWAYLKHEAYKPAGWLVAELAKARAWDGNFLPNVAPDSHGVLPEAYYKRMEQVGEWLKANGESIFGAGPGPWPERADVPVTVKGDVWHLHIDFLNEGRACVKGVPRPKSAKLLRTGEPVDFRYEDGTLSVELPEDSRSILGDVVAVEL